LNSSQSQTAPLAVSAGWHSLPRLQARAEWLDEGRGSAEDVAANLAEMARINRRLGGLSALMRHLGPRLLAAGGAPTLLDLGTGSADTLRAIGSWASRNGRQPRLIGIDSARRVLAVASAHARASRRGPRLLQADAARLPLAPGSADYVISTLFMHHYDPPELRALLRAAFGVARHGLVMSDLVRGRLPLAAFRLVQPVFARHAFTRHDGALSIRRAYTPAELRAIAAQAGLAHPRVYVHWPWRMTLVADHAPAAQADARDG
jgi:ubiquinone/menaquinone biosynthesis C-methylase UbiE